jgi:hypothetical protein
MNHNVHDRSRGADRPHKWSGTGTRSDATGESAASGTVGRNVEQRGENFHSRPRSRAMALVNRRTLVPPTLFDRARDGARTGKN